MHSSPSYRLLIIGAGFSGIAMGLRLLEQGEKDFLILDQATGIGGTWWLNRYPGCGCDVQSHLYSLSFAPRPEWSRQFAPREEIQGYLEDLVDRLGLRAHLRLGCRVEQARWMEAFRRWQITDEDGALYRSRLLVTAMGGLSRPNWPDIPGLASFSGPVIHSQQWPEDLDLAGQRVAVVGSGASAIQFVPEIQPRVKQLVLYQRTPQWILPKPDRAIARWKQTIYRRVPPARLLIRLGLFLLLESRLPAFNRYPALSVLHRRRAARFLSRQIKDPHLRQQLTPDYAMGCKRVLMSNDFYPALAQNNVELITEGIAGVDPNGIRDRSGQHRPADQIILATGFQASQPVPTGLILGRDGLDLADQWLDGPQAYKGSAVSGFPNLFMLMGPNTALGHNSVLLMIESQINYLLEAMRWLSRHQEPTLEVKCSAQRTWNRQLETWLKPTVWNSGGCSSWYLHPVSGRNPTLWPRSVLRFRRLTRHFDPDAYQVTR